MSPAMNRIKSALGQLVKLLLLVVVAVGVLYKMRVNIPALGTPKLYASLDSTGTRQPAPV